MRVKTYKCDKAVFTYMCNSKDDDNLYGKEKMTKVQLPRVDLEIRDLIDKFKVDHNLRNPSNRLGTFEDTLYYLVQLGEFVETSAFGSGTIELTEDDIDALGLNSEKAEMFKKFVKRK